MHLETAMGQSGHMEQLHACLTAQLQNCVYSITAQAPIQDNYTFAKTAQLSSPHNCSTALRETENWARQACLIPEKLSLMTQCCEIPLCRDTIPTCLH